MPSHTFLSPSLPPPAPPTMSFAHCYAMIHRPERIICSHADHSAGTISPYRTCQGWKAPRSVTWDGVGQCDILRWLGERTLMARELLENLRRLRLLIALAVGDGSYGSGRDAAAGFVVLFVRFWAMRRQVLDMIKYHLDGMLGVGSLSGPPRHTGRISVRLLLQNGLSWCCPCLGRTKVDSQILIHLLLGSVSLSSHHSLHSAC
ncbi:hypothetical protein HETIRDRAFT_308306 [Heterobasidion irregulare TC 32-1]|uniref:Uncharacterized protein n=1 Tax=Heterobasidion irregulare (strain TC 32-1) TaxID=747525 RepID=W4KPW8_HETIT|nr:uncharacterized protein HETIRDRAFT_308306 [Heterobasidion irregulare TC 32-1]ETW87837.1 hypothetical protein HETIRDRAFT_308306 [Heterobasidion irregulare TC 32-1]